MLVSVVAELDITRPASVPITHGEAMQAEFLRKVAALDARAAEYLHGGRDDQSRMYTISQIQTTRCVARDGFIELQPGSNSWFRITGIGFVASQAALAISERVDSWMGFTIRRWCTRPSEHPWSGLANVDAIETSARAAAEQDPHRSVIGFHSPTAFEVASGGGWDGRMPLPIPRLVFGSLRDRALASKVINAPLLDPGFIEQHVALGQFENISSQRLSFRSHGYSRSGFTGTCEFRFDKKISQSDRVQLHLLANLAFFIGVGQDTTRGMGQVRREASF